MSPTDVAGLQRSFRVGHRVAFIWLPLPAPGVEMKVAVQWVPDAPKALTRAERRLFAREFRSALSSCAAEMLRVARERRLLLSPDPLDHDRGRPQLDPDDPRLEVGDDDDTDHG